MLKLNCLFGNEKEGGRKMKKRRNGITVVICIIAMAVMLLAGCGKDGSETEKK